MLPVLLTTELVLAVSLYVTYVFVPGNCVAELFAARVVDTAFGTVSPNAPKVFETLPVLLTVDIGE